MARRDRQLWRKELEPEFKVIKELGRGAFGSVHQILYKQTNKFYALKCVKMGDMSKKERDYSLHEIEVLRKIKNNHVIRYKGHFDTRENELCMIMEFASGGALDRIIRNRKKAKKTFTEEEVLIVLIHVTCGLHCLHNHKVLHRDLKPANVLFFPGELVFKIADVGLSKGLGSTDSVAFSQCGTLLYMSPEVIEGRGYSYGADIWSLGCLLYELCTMRPPFLTNSKNHLMHKILRGDYTAIPKSSGFSDSLRRLIHSMLLLRPDRRPSTSEILSHPAVQAYAAGELRRVRTPEPHATNPIQVQQQPAESTAPQHSEHTNECNHNPLDTGMRAEMHPKHVQLQHPPRPAGVPPTHEAYNDGDPQTLRGSTEKAQVVSQGNDVAPMGSPKELRSDVQPEDDVVVAPENVLDTNEDLYDPCPEKLPTVGRCSNSDVMKGVEETMAGIVSMSLSSKDAEQTPHANNSNNGTKPRQSLYQHIEHMHLELESLLGPDYHDIYHLVSSYVLNRVDPTARLPDIDSLALEVATQYKNKISVTQHTHLPEIINLVLLELK
eukprot:Rmarinus@m.432